MSLNINFSMVGGNVGRTPELAYTKSGKAVTTISIATNDPSDKTATLWHNVVIWGKQAENTCKFVKKGRSVVIEGYNKPSTYTGKDGKQKSKHEIVARSVTFVGSGQKKDSKELQQDYTVEAQTVNNDMTFDANDIPF